MTINTEQFAAANKATVDSLLSVANTALASAERIAALNLNTARASLEDTVAGVQSVMSAKDPQAAMAAQKDLAQPALEKAVAYSRSMVEITTQTQQELAKMVEAQFSEFQKNVANMVEMAGKSAPAGSESAVAAIQNAIAAANKATVDSLLSVANTALASAERIAALNLNAARATLEDAASGVKSVLSAKDPKEALAVQSSLAQPAVEKAVAYSRSVYEITQQTQQELAKMVEAQFGDFQKSMATMVETASKSAPAGSEGAVAAIKSAIAAANSAFGNMNTVAKQFSDAAQANIASMTKNVK